MDKDIQNQKELLACVLIHIDQIARMLPPGRFITLMIRDPLEEPAKNFIVTDEEETPEICTLMVEALRLSLNDSDKPQKAIVKQLKAEPSTIEPEHPENN